MKNCWPSDSDSLANTRRAMTSESEPAEFATTTRTGLRGQSSPTAASAVSSPHTNVAARTLLLIRYLNARRKEHTMNRLALAAALAGMLAFSLQASAQSSAERPAD